ncbi:IclR family transcriptional regulator C-terminal domain-containing protein [Sinorhizobium meliloti]|uniref:IclR family transcriptional regulator n=1 Tax=Rhizobium meliloti TaxID=382 RepID=UPI0030B8139C
MRRVPRPLPREHEPWRYRLLGAIIPDLDDVVERWSLPTPASPILPLHLRPALLAGIAIVERPGLEMLKMLRVRVHLEPGSRVPLHCPASGKLLLAHMDAQQRQKLLASLTFERFTPATIMSADALETEFAEILCDGYSTDREEFMMGLIAIAVPVFDRNGRVVASLACHAPKARMTLDARRYVPVLQSAARNRTNVLTRARLQDLVLRSADRVRRPCPPPSEPSGGRPGRNT